MSTSRSHSRMYLRDFKTPFYYLLDLYIRTRTLHNHTQARSCMRQLLALAGTHCSRGLF